MFVSQVEQKTADRFRELFHSSWASAVYSVVTMLISIWLYAAVWANRHLLSRIPRPLTWWRAQLAQVGIHYPHWLVTVTDWHSPHDGGVVLLALAVGAVGAAAGASKSPAPGFSILALLALTLSTQWFGLGRSMEYYSALVGLLVAVAICMAARSWVSNRLPATIDRRGMHFDVSTVGLGLGLGHALRIGFKTGLLYGPVGVVLAPTLVPFALLWKAVCTLGYDVDEIRTPNAVDLLRRQLDGLEKPRVPLTLSDLPVSEAARLFAIVQVIAASPAMHREAVAALGYRAPTGAKPTSRVADVDVRPRLSDSPLGPRLSDPPGGPYYEGPR